MFEEVKEMIDSTIYSNGKGEVTAQNINLALHGIVDATEEKIDKVDDKVEKSDLKTINGESVLGKGDLKLGVKSVESVEKLEKLDAQVGDIVSVLGKTESAIVKIADAYIKSDSWEKLAKENIVSSEEELNGLDVPNGTIAKVTSGGKIVGSFNDFAYGYRVTDVEFMQPPYAAGSCSVVFIGTDGKIVEFGIESNGIECNIGLVAEGIEAIIFGNENGIDQELYDQAIALFKERKCTFNYVSCSGITVDSFVRPVSSSPYIFDAYIKGNTWDKLSKEYVVDSKDDLVNITASAGTIAKVARESEAPKFADFYQSNSTELASEDTIRANIDKFTRITSIDFNTPPYSFPAGLYPMLLYGTENPLKIEFLFHPQVAAASVYDELGNTQDFLFFDTRESSDINVENIKAVNDILSKGDYRYIPMPQYPELQPLYDIVFKVNYKTAYADAYIKGETWTRLLKEGDVTGGGKEDRVIYGFDEDLTAEQIESNKETYRLFSERKANILVLAGEIFLCTPSFYYQYNNSYVFVFEQQNYLGGIILKEDGTVEYDADPIVDYTLSTTSTNAVQNKVVTERIQQLEARIAALENK